MGLSVSRLWERMFGKKEMRILMVGLDAAGKVKNIHGFEMFALVSEPANMCAVKFTSYHSNSYVVLLRYPVGTLIFQTQKIFARRSTNISLFRPLFCIN